MIFNTDPAFVGLEKLKEAHHHQIADFEAWAAKNDWERFHYSHYDWWVFPINHRSAYGFKWTVYDGEIAQLKQDAEFMTKYLKGVQLVAASWGWEVERKSYLPNPKAGQSWHNWPIRLFKAAHSTQLFAQHDLFDSLKLYALDLMKQGKSMSYNNSDLSWLFTTGIDPRHP